MNSVNIIGRLGRDPETRYTGGGDAVSNFSIAVDNGFGDKKKTSWFKVTAWKKTAESVQKYLRKGSKVAVSGRLEERSWQDKGGEKRTSVEIVAERVDFLDPVNSNDAGETAQQQEEQLSAPVITDEDIPF